MHSVLLIGLGNVAVGYDINQAESTLCLTHAKAFSENPSFDLFAGVDVCNARRHRFSKIYKCQSFAEIEDAMNTIKPDVVVIATPTCSHLAVMENIFELVWQFDLKVLIYLGFSIGFVTLMLILVTNLKYLNPKIYPLIRNQ